MLCALALGLGLVVGDRRGALDSIARRPIVLGLGALCALQAFVALGALPHGLLASYSGPDGVPALARSIDYPELEGATRIDTRLDFDDEHIGIGLSRFPLGFLDHGPYFALRRSWSDAVVPLGTPRAREAFASTPRSAPEFSVHWRGFLRAPSTGSYAVRVESGGGSAWSVAGAAAEGSGAAHFELHAGEQVPIEVWHDQPEGAPARLRLLWATPGCAERVVPSSALTPGRAGPWRARLDGVAVALRSAALGAGTLFCLIVAAQLLAPFRLSPTRRWFLSVVGSAMGLRLIVHLVFFAQPHSSILQGLSNDDYRHLGSAAAVVLIDPLWPLKRAFYDPPMYRYFLAMTQVLLGEGLRSVALCQHVLGALTCGLVYVIGRRTFSHRAGVIAAGSMLFFPLLVYHETRVFATTLATFVLALATLVAMRARGVSSSGRGKTFAVGALLGFAVLTRPNLALFALPVAIWIAAGAHGLRERVRRFVLVGAGIVASVAPCTMKNAYASGEFVVVTTNGPVNLFIGNNPAATGRYRPPFRDDGEERFLGRVFEFVRDRPGDWLRLLARKAGLVLERRVLWIWYAGALLGWILARAKRVRGTFPISAGVVAVLGTPVIFFLFERFLVPGVPLLMLYAGFTVDRILPQRVILPPAAARVLTASMVLALAAAHLWVTIYGVTVQNVVRPPWDLGTYARWAHWVL